MSTPASWGWRRKAADALARAHVLRPAVSVYQTALGVRGAIAGRRSVAIDRAPVPPAQLRVRIGPAHADAATFVESGEQHARLIRDLLQRHDETPEMLAPILDFGCGCGRVARNWNGQEVGLNGCDVSRRMIVWCRENLVGRFEVNALEPPLPYADAAFGLVYAFSVFTHLPEQLQHDWLREFQRVLRPGGYVLLSTLGEYYVGLHRLTASERDAFDGGRLVVLFEDHAGESFCSAYHPRGYVEATLARELEYLEYQQGYAADTHDMHLLRKPVSIRDAAIAATR